MWDNESEIYLNIYTYLNRDSNTAIYLIALFTRFFLLYSNVHTGIQILV